MKLLLAGATGLVGGLLLSDLLQSGHSVTVVARRPTGRSHPMLEEVVTDFAGLSALPQAEAALCTLGTTMAKAGSKSAFRAVDQEAVGAFARATHASGCPHFLCVTAVGADPEALAFYSRVKGEAERDLAAIGFKRLDLIRPGLIVGARTERRPAESIAQRVAPVLDRILPDRMARYRSIRASSIASGMVALLEEEGEGTFIHHNEDLLRMAGLKNS